MSRRGPSSVPPSSSPRPRLEATPSLGTVRHNCAGAGSPVFSAAALVIARVVGNRDAGTPRSFVNASRLRLRLRVHDITRDERKGHADRPSSHDRPVQTQRFGRPQLRRTPWTRTALIDCGPSPSDSSVNRSADQQPTTSLPKVGRAMYLAWYVPFLVRSPSWRKLCKPCRTRVDGRCSSC